jgi:hypothetical protein
MRIGMGLGDHRQKFSRQRCSAPIVATQLAQAHLISEDFNQKARVEIGNATTSLPRVRQPLACLRIVLPINLYESKRSSSGRLPTRITELIAEREGIAPSYMTRVLRLTLLAPDIVQAILDGTQGPELTLAQVLEPFPFDWQRQRVSFGATMT